VSDLSTPFPAGGRAVILGGGIAGLLAARVLAETYETVAVLDRDVLPSGPTPRGGVPHGRHAHALLAQGTHAFEDLFPGITAELVARGAAVGDVLADATWYPGGRRLRSVPSGLSVVSASRPLLEAVVRARVSGLAAVEAQSGTDAVELRVESGRVRGVLARTRGGPPAFLAADLVVDATGRTSRTPAWLAAHGYAPPQEERLQVDIGYATCVYRVPPDVMRGRIAIVHPRTARRPRGAVANVIEGDRVMVSFAGYGTHRPEATAAGLLAHARSLGCPDLEAIVTRGEPLDAITRFHVTANVRRRYEELQRFPEGLLVVGDALCAFNPVFAQGMSVAALQALALRDSLAAGAEGLWRRFFRAAADVVGNAWKMGAANDLEIPGVAGRRPLLGRLVSAWMRQVLAAAETDDALSRAVIRVANLLDPPQRLCSWRVAARVLAARWAPAPLAGAER
jgi:2-polyprenyl-6-methoxyphenol hydroxylase-like FAD-dependent oxidoreductase